MREKRDLCPNMLSWVYRREKSSYYVVSERAWMVSAGAGGCVASYWCRRVCGGHHNVGVRLFME